MQSGRPPWNFPQRRGGLPGAPHQPGSTVDTPNQAPSGNWRAEAADSALVFQQSDGPVTGDTPWGLVFGARANATDWRAFWSSPLLDLRPDQVVSSAYSPNAEPVELVEQSGITLSLFWQCFNEGLFATGVGDPPAVVTARYVERGHPANPVRVKAYTAPLDFTAPLFTGNEGEGSSLVRFDLLGPLRFTQIVIAIDIDNTGWNNLQSRVVKANGSIY